MKNISVRLTDGDLSRIKGIASRLGTKNSDVIRYSVKTSLNRLIIFNDANTDMQILITEIIDNFHELNWHFDLNTDKLEQLLNHSNRNSTSTIDKKDIELISYCGMPVEFTHKKLQQIFGTKIDRNEVNQFLKNYLLDKYCLQEQLTYGESIGSE